jgi:hypothetical protein
MAKWMTGAEISARYIASEQKLLDYARHGNMPMLRRHDGSVLFDEEHAAILFRPRGPSPVLAAPADGEPNLGALGVSRLGASRPEGPIREECSGERAARKAG